MGLTGRFIKHEREKEKEQAPRLPSDARLQASEGFSARDFSSNTDKRNLIDKTIYSKLFGENIRVISDSLDLGENANRGEVIYTESEIGLLKDRGQDTLKVVHMIKKEFKGSSVIEETSNKGEI